MAMKWTRTDHYSVRNSLHILQKEINNGTEVQDAIHSMLLVKELF